jgi:Uma2 family endonuclease
MPVVVPRYTNSDLESFPDDGNRYELLDGILLVSPGPAPLHQVVLARLLSALHVYTAPAGLAMVFARGTVELEPNNHLEPDILVMPAGGFAGVHHGTRWTEFRTWWLAVEVSGTGSMVYDRDHKMPAYLALGVREAWRVDLDECVVEVSRHNNRFPTRHTDQLTWHPPPDGSARSKATWPHSLPPPQSGNRQSAGVIAPGLLNPRNLCNLWTAVAIFAHGVRRQGNLLHPPGRRRQRRPTRGVLPLCRL